MPTNTYTLSREDIQQFHQDGYLSPFTLCTPEKMDDIRPQVEKVLATDSPHSWREQSRHLDSRIIYDLCAHPAIVQRMACIYGPDLVIWRSNFFVKNPGDKAIPWHQDRNYWPIEPPINITAWIAIDEARVENSCLQIIPGSHKLVVPHIKATEDMGFNEMADTEYIDTSKAVNLELKPGQFFLFNERLVHYSAPNTSDKRRMGLAVRVTIPIVKVDHDELFKGHKVLQLCGTDPMGFNEVGEPPVN
jgi:ectoine hydroxylase-related dioxygenase (phytanoyl-CoA dioxygenase family)